MVSYREFFASNPYETLGWILFGAAGCIIGWVFTHQLEVHERPIPFQLLNDEYVRDLSFDLIRPDKDTVSTILTYVLAGLIPLLLQIGLAFKFGPKTDVMDTITIYLVTFGTTLLATEPTKWYISWLRPNFYEMCEPNETFTICESHEPSGEARHSFPSGHSVTAFSGMTILSYYLHFRFGVAAYRRKLRGAQSQEKVGEENEDVPEGGEKDIAENKETPGSINRSVLNRHRIISMVGFIIPQGLAIFIGASRIRDNRHFPADILAGALIGVATALFVTPLWWFDEGYDG